MPDAARAANREIAALVDASPREIVEPDMRFHRSLIDALGSERTSRLYDALASEVVFCMSQVQGAALLPTQRIAAEHDRLLELIEAGDGDAAASCSPRTSAARASDSPSVSAAWPGRRRSRLSWWFVRGVRLATPARGSRRSRCRPNRP